LANSIARKLVYTNKRIEPIKLIKKVTPIQKII